MNLLLAGIILLLVIVATLIVDMVMFERRVDNKLKRAYDYPGDPQDDPAYQKMVEELAQQCTCTGLCRPCDGLLAGGLCDDMHMDEWRGDPDVDANDE